MHVRPPIDAIEKLIVAGEIPKAQVEIAKAVKAKPPREDRAPMARLARRANLPETSLRLLNPIVRVEGRKLAEVANENEVVEYASALRNVGAVEEAIELLESIHKQAIPESLFLLALSYFSRWDYPHAIPILREYIKCDGLSDYQRLVGEVNLASALIHEGALDEGERLLAEIERRARGGAHRYLLGKTIYFGAELEVLKNRPARARECLKKAQEFLAGTSELDLLLSRMWLAIANHQEMANKESRAALTAVRAEALAASAWEIVRNCDLHSAWFSRDESLFEFVYFGTPSGFFRKRMAEIWPEGIPAEKAYDWVLCPGAKPAQLSARQQGDVLKTGSVPHRLLRALQSDFYRPFRIAELHTRIYPGEFYEPVSASAKVRQAIKLMRARFKAKRLPLTVEEKDSAYRIAAKSAFVLVVAKDAPESRNDDTLRKLHQAFPNGFGAKEAADKLGESRRTLLRILVWAVKAGHLKKTGSTKSARYNFVDHPAK